MQLTLFAVIDWTSAFTMGLIGSGGALVLTALVFFVRAITANRDESKQFENNQPIQLASLGIGVVFIVGGLYFRGSLGNLTTNSESLSSFAVYESKEGRFKASFPGSPSEQTKNVLGMKIKFFSVEEKDGVFAVAYIDFPVSKSLNGKQADTVLTSARNGMLQNMGAKLVKEDRITLQGKYPGREIKADVPNRAAEMYCSIYLVNNRAYQVLIAGKSAWLNSDKARKFLNSFALR